MLGLIVIIYNTLTLSQSAVRLLEFRAKIILQVKGKRQEGTNLIPNQLE